MFRTPTALALAGMALAALLATACMEPAPPVTGRWELRTIQGVPLPARASGERPLARRILLLTGDGRVVGTDEYADGDRYDWEGTYSVNGGQVGVYPLSGGGMSWGGWVSGDWLRLRECVHGELTGCGAYANLDYKRS